MKQKFFLYIIIASILLISTTYTFAQSDKLTLKQQIDDKIDWDDIQCSNPQHVLTERSNGKIACVSEYMAKKFGWYINYPNESDLIFVFKVIKDNTVFDVNYNIRGGTIKDIVYDKDVNSLLLTINSTDNGKLKIKIPRILLDVKMDYCPPQMENSPDGQFFVLIDGLEVFHREIITTSENRTLQISFLANTTNIEILGTCNV